MTTHTISFEATATAPKASLFKRIGLAAYRLLEQMTESAYRQNQGRLRYNFYI
ncbi:hypothetical protein [Billgrantia bachuensis]|uniref:Uncharacterized protein n=1 Tax=Billgrantia bachuensis TaxID=2717286 RepID=A0ABX0PYA5_9GAMM|nr:hypothetical protein [Halomonas bachuensis]NIC07172.1 hypothetical protein [Halomonas bachuensis]